MLELATLGLLLSEPMHGYQLKAVLEQYVGVFLSPNYGSIYPILRRFEEDGLIRGAENPGKTIRRRVYRITEEGKARWREEMLTVPNDSWINARSRFMTKFFFFKDLEPENRIGLLQARLAACRKRLTENALIDLPRNTHQYRLFDFASHQLGAEIGWLEMQLRREEAELGAAQA